jgi:nucleoside 2-deoxyribosyltransferase
MSVYIYLAGPVSGKTDDEANLWRTKFAHRLESIGMVGVSPIRYEPVKPDGAYLEEGQYDLELARQIITKNRLDVQRCDLTLAYMPTESRGTLQEIGWAYGMEKPIVVVSDLAQVLFNPVIMGSCPWRFRDDDGEGLTQAFQVIRGLFSVYR